MSNNSASQDKLFTWIMRPRFIALTSALTCLIAIATSSNAIQFKEARVSQIVNDVKVLPGQAAPRPAVVSELVRSGSAVRTGTQSRSELTFADLTITRLGANTIFSFNEGTREMNLTDGAILFQVPKGSGGATIRTVGVTAAITGTTGIAEYHPATTSHPLFSKWLCLEGTFRIILANGQSVELGPGRMVTTDGKSFSKVSTFDIAKLVKTSLFFIGFDTPLPPEVLNLIALEEQKQAEFLLAGEFIDRTTNPLDPTRIVNVINQGIVAEEGQTSPPPPPPPPTTPPPPPTPTTPPPTPTKLGTPSTITSPNPYLITSGTVITTDPSITTNGVTDFGKVWRGSDIDGAFSQWAFGSTSAFDTAFIDGTFFADPTHFPIAAFKFQSLSLNGNPIIDTSNGGVTKLALIGVDGITSGPPGGTLTFTGVDLLALATVNGSINLTSDISFQDISVLGMYARGAGSNLTINSPISNIGTLELAAEHSIQLTNPGTMSVGEFDAVTGGGDLTLQIGGSLLLDGKVRLDAMVLPGATVASGANLTLNVTGDYTNSSTTEFSRLAVTNQGHIGTGGNISVNIDGNLTATGPGSPTDFPAPGDIELLVQNTKAQIDTGGNLNLTVNGNVQVNGLIAYLQNYDFTANPAGHIGTGGNIDIEIGGNLTANSYADVFLNNRGGGMIDSGGNLTFNVGGALIVGPGSASGSGYAQFVVSNRYDDSAGNTIPPVIGSDVALNFHAGSIDITLPPGPDTFFTTYIGNRGGTIDGNASVNLTVSHDFNSRCDADIDILNDGGSNAVTPFGGTIHGDATVQVSAANVTVPAGSFELLLANQNGGVIDSNATIDFDLTGNLTTGDDATFLISNHQNLFSNGLPGGSIGSAATLSINAANISAGNDFAALIRNQRDGNAPGPDAGSIGTNAVLNITTGSFTVGSDLDVMINNVNGGTIGGNAAINVTANNISSGDVVDATIDNSAGSTIGGNALVNVGVSNDINIVGDATFQILNNDGAHIGGNANILVTTGDGGDLTANSIFAFINNRNGGTIGSAANINFDIGGALSTTGDALFVISNRNDGSGGGTVGSSVDLTLSAASISGGGNLVTDVSTNQGGHIMGSVHNTVDAAGLLSGGTLDFEIENAGFDTGGGFEPGGTIDADAMLSVTASGISTTSDYFNAIIANDGGGHIGGNATVSVLASSMDVATNAYFDILNSPNGTGTPAGTIGGDAAIQVNMGNMLVGGFIDAEIDNHGGGNIVSGANINFNLTGDLTTMGDAAFLISNDPGGTIGSGAVISLTANDVSTGGILNVAIDNSNGGMIGGNANLSFNLGGDLTTQDDANFTINNSNGGTIGADSLLTVNRANISIGGSLFANNVNYSSGSIVGSANINFNLTGDLTAVDDATIIISNDPGGTIGSGAIINLSANDVSTGGILNAAIDNSNGGMIGGNANLSFNLGGDLTTQGDANFTINNSNGGTIGADAAMNVSAANISTGIGCRADIANYANGNIVGSAMINFNLTGDLTVQGDATLLMSNNPSGTIGSDAVINLSANNVSTGGVFNAAIDNTSGGTIGGIANLSVNLGGDLATQGDAGFDIFNSNGGRIGGDSLLNVNAANISTGGSLFANIYNYSSGNIGGNANLNFNLTGDLTVQGDATLLMSNNPSGTIGSDAVINVTANNVSIGGIFNAAIDNSSGGMIGGNANLSFNLGGDLTTQGDASFTINNSNGGMIGADAAMTVNAASVSTVGSLFANIFNYSNGTIVGNANLTFTLTGDPGDLTTQGDALFSISNGGGTIGGNATVEVSAGNITANSLFARIDNPKGSIGASTEGGATINMNVSGTATVTNDATVAIYGSDGAVGGAAININGGNYDVTGIGQTFLTYIDGNGTITFNNASMHADVLKAGVFGTNGVLNIGGGILSADTTLKLYAPGSNGALNFVSNVTLNSNLGSTILAANSVTIFNNVVVTIGGKNAADVYTNNANYTGFGGNGTTTGTFAGAGANKPQPLASAPPFGPATPNHHNRVGGIPRPQFNVRNSDELLALLDGAKVGPDGKITVRDSKITSNSRNSNRTDVADRSKAGSRVNPDRHAMDMRTASSSVIRRSPQ